VEAIVEKRGVSIALGAISTCADDDARLALASRAS